MHNLKFIRRRFPGQAARIEWVLILASASALALGAGLLLLR